MAPEIWIPLLVTAITVLGTIGVAAVNKATAKAGVEPTTVDVLGNRVDKLFERIDQLEDEIESLKSARDEEREIRHALRAHLANLEQVLKLAFAWITKVAIPTFETEGVEFDPPPHVVLKVDELFDWPNVDDNRRVDVGPPVGTDDRRRTSG